MTEDPFAPGLSAQKREARERAIELLYEAEVRGISIGDVLASQVVTPAQLVEDLTRGVSEDIERIDAEIDAYLNEGWSLDRLGMLDLWILRIGIYELLLGQIPVAVVINEAVELGNLFGATEDSGKFINGILGSAAREME
ncbi:MAG TPA: transcription antitermination factor NusB [Acidimicrobiaceae bacterium]|nr:transcription antitermination factor NusB [Acidimicrobiaceae bacterium]HAX06350.1 transcription antitermination factor NusB [Acidimicrobiaceae bacterium]